MDLMNFVPLFTSILICPKLYVMNGNAEHAHSCVF